MKECLPFPRSKLDIVDCGLTEKELYTILSIYPLDHLSFPSKLNFGDYHKSGLFQGVDLTFISEFFKHNTKMTHLQYIFRAKMPSEFFFAMMEGLKGNKIMTTVELSQFQFTEKGLSSLGEMLKINSTLKVLTLKTNSQKDPLCIKHLAEALKVNETLEELTLYNVKLGPQGIAFLAEALSLNKTLKKLNLNFNELGPDSIDSIVKIIKENTSLTTFCLERNQLDLNDGVKIATALADNSNIKILGFFCNDFSKESIASIHASLKRNCEA